MKSLRKTRKKLLMLALSLALALTGCGTPAAPQQNPQRTDLNGPGAQAATDFALKLLNAALAKDPGKDTLLSPLSVLCALTMTANGAAGETLAQFEEVLGLPISELGPYLAAYCAAMPNTEKARFHSANSLWLREGAVEVEEAFLQTNAGQFEAEVFEKPFDSKTLEEINSWVEEHTDGMIPKIIEEIKPETMLYLINALAFEAEWEEIYEDFSVRQRIFTQEDGTESQVDMMESMERTYLEDEGATGFLKYYAGQKYAFAALLPHEGTSLASCLQSLSGQRLRQILTSAQERDVIAGIPKFQQECGFELSGVLQSMGLEAAFDSSAADFSAIGRTTDGQLLYIGQVLHKSFISVFERGTKAGAATAVAVEAGSAMQDEPARVILDRPFIYMLVDTEAMVPVFIGAAYAPGQG